MSRPIPRRAHFLPLALAIGVLPACDTMDPESDGAGNGGEGDSPGARGAEVPAPHEQNSTPGGERATTPGGVMLTLESECGLTTCKTASLRVTVESRRDDAVHVEVFIAGFGLDARSASLRVDPGDAGGVLLPAHTSQTFTIPAEKLPIQSVGTMSHVFATAAIHTDDGGTITSLTTPLSVEHDKGFTGITVFNAMDAGARPFDSDALFALNGRVYDGDQLVDVHTLPAQGGSGYTVGGGQILMNADPSDELPNVPAPPPGPDDPSTRVCVQLRAMYSDAGFGEDVDALPPSSGKPAEQMVPAAYLHTELKDAGGGTLFAGPLDAQGCTPAMELKAGNYQVWTTTLLSRELDAKATAVHEILYQTGVTAEGEPVFNRPYWVNAVTLSGGGSTTVSMTGTGWHPAMNVAAVSARIFTAADGLLTGAKSLILVDGACPDLPPGNSCTSQADNTLFLGTPITPTSSTNNALFKFIIAHENGHLIEGQHTLMAKSSLTEGDDEIDNQACRCDHIIDDPGDNTTHCMQSREEYGAGFKEGFAHFYASMIYNSRDAAHCDFVYYKPINVGILGILEPPMRVDCDTVYEWRDDHCTPPDGGPQTAVEMDYMRFLWNVYSKGPNRLSATEIMNIFQSAKSWGIFGLDWPVVELWAKFDLGLGSPKYLNFVQRAHAHAVDDDYD